MHYDRYNGMENLLGTNLTTKRTVKGFPIDADLLMLKVEEEYGFRARDRLYEIIRTMSPYELPSAQPKKGRWISADAMFHGVPFYCSECGENTRDTAMGKPRWKFCPMCGAKMEVTT